MLKKLVTSLLVALPLLASQAHADAKFEAFIQTLWPKVKASGISRSLFDAAFAGITDPDPAVLKLAQTQPEFTSTTSAYLEKAVTPIRIDTGKQMKAQEATLLSAIGAAETSVRLTNAYFAPDPQLLAALKAAAGRGVDVSLILPAQTDSWLVFHTGRGYYEQLLSAGVKIYLRRGVVLHSKTALIDGVWATVGSTNLDW